jgi:hypothetical protein
MSSSIRDKKAKHNAKATVIYAGTIHKVFLAIPMWDLK